MTKVVYAAKEDVEKKHEQLQAELGQLKELQSSISGMQTKLQAEVAALKTKVDATSASLSESASSATVDTAVSAVKSDLTSLLTASEVKLHKAMSALEEKLQAAQSSLRDEALSQIDSIAKKLEEGLQTARAHAETTSGKLEQSTQQALSSQKGEFDSMFAGIQTAVGEGERRLREALERGLAGAGDSIKDTDKRLQAAASAEHDKVQGQLDKLNREMEELHGNHGAQSEKHSGLESDLEDLDAWRRHTEAKLQELQVDHATLRNAVSEVENITTRRVEWVIKDVSSKIRPNSPSNASLHRSWFSPRFDAGGLHGLQLELQYFRPTTKGFDLDDEAGDTCVFLWACKGTKLVFKLSVGNKVQELEKVFNGRVPFGTRRFCWLKDQINRDEDSLRVGVEILECVREVEHVIEAPAAVIDTKEADLNLEGIVLFHRHVNNRMLALVQKQVDLLNARMIRRVEWRVEQASMLRRCFPPGSPICSTQFAAAGLEGLQLIFYPSGYTGAQEGFCSVFLHGPAGAMLRGYLIVGPQRRELHHFYEAPGAFGRTNFCRFEGMVEESHDTITLALEIEEAHQDNFATTSHPKVLPGDPRTQAQIEGEAQGAIESVVKVQKVPGRPGVGLETVRQLPSLWSPQPADNKQAKLASTGSFGTGFQTYGQLKAYEPPPLKLPSPWKGPAAALAGTRSESMPALADKATGRSPPLAEDSVDSMASTQRKRRTRVGKAL
mmetsp:Transcript_56426/g.104446  ORF Transcript_56426/g.104446 Transcript_56426/m.104446 type:complete len:725 (+) Transcript_56426:32-2206(+)